MNELEMKAMIFGFMYGDGWISHINRDKYNHYCAGFSGNEESLQILKDDLISLYGDIGKAIINTRETKSESYGISGMTSSISAGTVVAKDMVRLGMPIGKKVEQEYLLPDWICNGSLRLKSSFISGLYAAEGYTPSTQKNDKTFKPLGFNITKRSVYFENFQLFIKQISSILDDLKISHSISYVDTVTCDLNKKAIITFNNSTDNLINALCWLNMRYCTYKASEMNYMFNYLIAKVETIIYLQEAYDLAIKRTCSANEVAKQFGISRSTVENWRSRLSGIRIPNSFYTYTTFKSCCPL